MSLDADLAGDDTRPMPADCETVDQGAIDEGRDVKVFSRVLRVSSAGTRAHGPRTTIRPVLLR